MSSSGTVQLRVVMSDTLNGAACDELLARRINGGGLFRAASAHRIAAYYAGWADVARQHAAESRTAVVPRYAGSTDAVHRLSTYLSHHCREHILGAVVHGSVGTEEVVPFSDLDALVILRDQSVRSPARLAAATRHLAKARRFMFQHDPLQHHGWQVLTEADLWCYSQAVFPPEIFPYSRSIGQADELRIVYRPRHGPLDVRQAYLSVSRSLLAQLRFGRVCRNMYTLKSALSMFLLLPSLYVHARDLTGVFKRFSFDMARADFTEEDWEPMARASQIRERWHYAMGPIRRWLLCQPWRMRRQIAARLAPSIPDDIRALCSSSQQAGMITLTGAMTAKLGL